MRRKRSLARALFSAAVALALGFGAAQAAAAPGSPQTAAEARRCDPERCDASCKKNIPGSTGVCVGGTSGRCDCLLGP